MNLFANDGQVHNSDDAYGSNPALEGVYLGAGYHRLDISGYESGKSGGFEVSWEVPGD